MVLAPASSLCDNNDDRILSMVLVVVDVAVILLVDSEVELLLVDLSFLLAGFS